MFRCQRKCRRFEPDYPLHFMYNVKDSDGDLRGRASTLSQAMEMAKLIDEFVTITNGTIEIVGIFGVDSVENGVCPDGVAYDWNKASRIGAEKRNRG